MLERVSVWQAPVRILHWVHVACMGILAYTGYYIGHPFIGANESAATYLMGTTRTVHFATAFVFVGGFVARAYWFIFGNQYERWGAWLPTTRRRWREFWTMQKYYLFLIPERPNYVGVNPIAGVTYLALGVLIVIQAITGFALFSLPFRTGFWHVTFGQLNFVFGAQILRLIHHVLLWVFVVFFVAHIYLAVLDDIEEQTGGFVSIISGEKCEPNMRRGQAEPSAHR